MSTNPSYDQGLVKMRAGDVDGAIESFTRAIRQVPRDVYAYNKLAFLYKEKRLFRKAIRVLETALKVRKDDFHTHYILGNTLLDQARYAEAAEAFKQSLSLNPKDVYAWNSLALAHKLVKQYDRAIQCLEKAIELDPADAYNYNSLAVVHFCRGDLEQGAHALERGLKHTPDNAFLAYTQGEAYLRMGQLARSAECFSRLIERAPQSKLGHIGLGHLAIAKAAWKSALAHFLRALELDPKDWEVLTFMGEIYLDMRDFEQADVYFSRALDLNPRSSRGLLGKGETLESQGLVLKAWQCYQQAVRAAPASAESRFTLGRLYLEQRIFSKAVQELRAAHHLDASNDTFASHLGWALVDGGWPADGERLLRQVLAKNSSHACSLYQLARTLLANGNRRDEAAGCLRALAGLKDGGDWKRKGRELMKP
ncbi:MAG: tetratricopeptide repeat protein [Candidatus Wallbacteria bacterium]|nr:tetratricopeptide repeat protein [Candidatus Wallbacteria bacterium]